MTTTQQLTFATWLAGVLSRWRVVVVTTTAVLLTAVLLAVLLPPVYRARSSFVTASGSLQLPSGLSGLANVASRLGVSAGSDPEESPAFYAQLLQSRELLTRLVNSKFPDPRSGLPADSVTLIQVFRLEANPSGRSTEMAIKKLTTMMTIEPDARTNLVSLTVDTRWPTLSAGIANRSIQLVSQFNVEQRQSRARSRRVFIESRAAGALTDLHSSEDELRTFYVRNRQWQSSPTLTLEEGRLRRELEVANDLYLTVRREFESARIDEVNDTPVITVVDSAVVPQLRRWPKLILMTLSGGFFGVGLGLAVAGMLELTVNWMGRNPEQATLLRSSALHVLQELRSAVRTARQTEATTSRESR